MPKVIVYVPAAAWRRLEERGLDPAKAVREFARRGYEIEPDLAEAEHIRRVEAGVDTRSSSPRPSVDHDWLLRRAGKKK